MTYNDLVKPSSVYLHSWLLSALLLMLAACADQSHSVTVAEPSTTSTPQMTPLLEAITSRPSPTTPATTIEPTPIAHSVDALDEFSEQLKSRLITQDWAAIEAISAETVQFGILPYGISGYAANQAIPFLKQSYITAGSIPSFAENMPDGIDPTAHFYSTDPIVRVIYGSGFGPDQAGDGLIYIVESPDGAFGFGGMVLSYNQFAPPIERLLMSPPPGLLYRNEGLLWRVMGDGSTESLFPIEGNQRISINPQGTRALLFEHQFQSSTVTAYNLSTETSQTFTITLEAAGQPVATWHDQWLSETVAVIGVWDAAAHEDKGLNGAAALLDVIDGNITLLDGETMMASVPSTNNGRIVWATVEGGENKIKLWQDGTLADISTDPFFELGISTGDNSLFSPAISADGRIAWWTKGSSADEIILVLADGDNVEPLISIPPLAISGFAPPAVWSPDGRRLAFKAWTASPLLDGIHIYDTENQEFTYLGIGSDKPFWYDNRQLIYTQAASPYPQTLFHSQAMGELALPAGAVFERLLPDDCNWEPVQDESRFPRDPFDTIKTSADRWSLFELPEPMLLCLWQPAGCTANTSTRVIPGGMSPQPKPFFLPLSTTSPA